MNFGSGADAERQRDEPEDGGERGHQDGAQAHLAGVDGGFLQSHSRLLAFLLMVPEQGPSLDEDAAQHDGTHN